MPQHPTANEHACGETNDRTFEPARSKISPSGTRSAKAFTIMDELQGNTQVMVDFGTGGGGVFALDLPNVHLRLRWIDDSQLVIAYPEEMTASKREGRIQNYRDVVTLTYETFGGYGERIAALEKAFGRSTLAERRKLLPRRGQPTSSSMAVSCEEGLSKSLKTTSGTTTTTYTSPTPATTSLPRWGTKVAARAGLELSLAWLL